jgi:acetyl-CoA carboxylase biotin carboxyl carrier protein
VKRQKILELIELMEENGLAELEIGTLFRRIRISRVGRADSSTFVPAEQEFSASPAEIGAVPSEPMPKESGLHEVKAPLVGTFYKAPSPGAPEYVQVGDVVKKGQVLCILEAMKVMNEIEADHPGTVREILADNGDSVEFGQVLLRIEP